MRAWDCTASRRRKKVRGRAPLPWAQPPPTGENSARGDAASRQAASPLHEWVSTARWHQGRESVAVVARAAYRGGMLRGTGG